MADKNVSPALGLKSFTCPHCGSFAQQDWFYVLLQRQNFLETLKREPFSGGGLPFGGVPDTAKIEFLGGNALESTDQKLSGAFIAFCAACSELSFWITDQIVYPTGTSDITPNADLPQDIREDLREAIAIRRVSPRGSAALARLCIQKLCKHLGKPGTHLNDDIGALVKDGLSPQVQQALDYVRVVGNESVHPGTIMAKDDIQTAEMLCKLVNIIAEQLITQPRLLSELYNGLPASKIAAIEKRDS